MMTPIQLAVFLSLSLIAGYCFGQGKSQPYNHAIAKERDKTIVLAIVLVMAVTVLMSVGVVIGAVVTVVVLI